MKTDELVPTRQDACEECNKGESIYDDPEELQSKMLSRKEYAKVAYCNGFINCYDWIYKQLTPQKKMISTELRIGNLVHYHIEDSMDERKEWDEVNPIDYDDLRILTEFKDNPEYKPIILTVEWLKKLHRNEDEIEISKRFPNEITIYDRFLFIWKESYKYWYVVTTYSKEYLTKIEFVHEYQNFIYALTGEELTIKQ